MIRTALDERAQGVVARLTVDNPSKLNILTPETLEALVSSVKKAETNPQLRAIVLTGAGDKAFIGGADLATLGKLEPTGSGPTSAREFITKIHRACAALRDCPVPVVARIHGWCLGAGLEIAACCDLRIASRAAVFGMPEVRLGIPSVVEAAVLPRLVGAGRARWLVMTGETIDAKEALAWGLVEKLFEEKDLDAGVDRALDALLAGEPAALRAQKRLCRLWEEAPLAESVRASIDEFAQSYEAGEPGRRIAAFRKARGKP